MENDKYEALCVYLDLQPDGPYRTLAFMDSEWLQGLLASLQFQNTAASPAYITQAGLLARTCRF
eukprot:6108089-Amphidinium_carterae.1